MRGAILKILAGTALAVAATAANAAVTLAGGATGCFSALCAPGATATDKGLTFTGGSSTFSQTTDSTGFAAVGGPSNNFGTFTLVPNAGSYTNDLFTLLITFTNPLGSSGTFNATLLGSLVSFGDGGVNIHFTNPDQTIASSIGPLTLHVNDVAFSGSLLPRQDGPLNLRQDISGYILALPEPGTWGMMLLGFAGIGFTMRRRRSPALAQIA